MTPIRRLALVAATILAVGAGPLVTEADAKHKHKHNRYCDHDRDGRYDRYERHNGRYRYDDRARSYDSGRCADVQRRISKARYEIQKNEGTGRHEDALRWFKNDLRKAHAESARYCGGRGGSSWGWDDVYYDRYDRYEDYDDRYDYGRYDPYYGGGREDFELKRDWPALLGLFLGGGAGANLGY